MTSIDELFSGICIIVDDELGKNNSTDVIMKIKLSIEQKNIPILAYSELPIIEQIKHFKNLSFVLLDWDINPIEAADKFEGVSLGEVAAGYNQDAIVTFIKEVNKESYLPIFIFSNENIEIIKTRLVEEKLIDSSKRNNIFIKSKGELINTPDNENVLFDEIEKWMKETPSIYVLKEWGKAIALAQKEIFWEFSAIHHQWPNILWRTFKDDNIEPNYEISYLLLKNIETRIMPLSLESEILEEELHSDDLSESITRVIEATKYIKYTPPILGNSLSSLGDIYKRGNNYYVNIRPACDCIERREGMTDTIYLLKGKVVKKNIPFDEKYGFLEKIGECYVFPIDDGKIICFKFKDLEVEKYEDYKPYKKGKLLMPYITYLTEKYSFYLQRQGLPKIPIAAIDKEKILKNEEMPDVDALKKKIELYEILNKNLLSQQGKTKRYK
jgi:hypothetical protein